MKVIYAKEGQALLLGHNGENDAVSVRFNISQWRQLYGDGSVQLLHQRYGEQDPYPVSISVYGTTVIWNVSSADAGIPGVGSAELQYFVGDTIVKSNVWKTNVFESLGKPTETPPEPYQDWVEQVLHAKIATQEAADRAENVVESVEAAAGRVESAAVRQPIANTETGTWWIWDVESEAYINSGVSYFPGVKSVNGEQGDITIPLAGSDNAGLVRVCGKVGTYENPVPVMLGEDSALYTETPDWNAADGEIGHILNRTHYSWFETTSETREFVATSADGGYIDDADFAKLLYANRQTAKYTVNDIEFEYMPDSDSDTLAGTNNITWILQRSDTVGKWYVWVDKGLTRVSVGDYGAGRMSTATITVEAQTETVHPLDEKYIPDTIARTGAIEAVQSESDSKQDTLTGIEGQIVGFDADGNAVAQESRQPDWNAAEGEDGYVLNRTHWTETVEKTVEIEVIPSAGTESSAGLYIPVSAADAKLIYDNLGECVFINSYYGDNAQIAIIADEPTGTTRSGSIDGASALVVINIETNTLSSHYSGGGGRYGTLVLRTQIESIHPLDPKYLPDEVVTETEFNTALNTKADAADLEAKQDVITGTSGQIVGFDADGKATTVNISTIAELAAALVDDALLTAIGTGEVTA